LTEPGKLKRGEVWLLPTAVAISLRFFLGLAFLFPVTEIVHVCLFPNFFASQPFNVLSTKGVIISLELEQGLMLVVLV
jgi:hypothetical protein